MNAAEQPVAGRTRPAGRISPAAVRGRLFSARRRGIDSAEVYAFLHEVAAELAALQRELIIAHCENQRLRRALRDRRTLHPTAGYRPDQLRPSWPVNPG